MDILFGVILEVLFLGWFKTCTQSISQSICGAGMLVICRCFAFCGYCLCHGRKFYIKKGLKAPFIIFYYHPFSVGQFFLEA